MRQSFLRRKVKERERERERAWSTSNESSFFAAKGAAEACLMLKW
jgi:hypothetical protein